MEESKNLEQQAKELLREAKKVERIEKACEQSKEFAMILGNMRDCFLAEGFSAEESYDLLKTLITTGGIK